MSRVRPGAAVFLLSAAVLAHEVCLLRVLALAYWHHAAALVVSVALLAFGAAGTLLAVAPRLRGAATFPACACAYAVAVPLSLRAGGGVDFNVLEVGWDPTQWLRLLALEGLFLLPFLLAATAIAVALDRHARAPGGIYAANLAGSGLGALAAPLLLEAGSPAVALGPVAWLAAAAALPWLGLRRSHWAVLAGVAAWVLGGVDLPMSPYKALPSAPDRRILETHWGPRGRVDRVDVPSLHFAPGLALTAPVLPENQVALYVDGHLVAAVDRGSAAYLDHTVGALPFVAAPPRGVLLLGVGPDLARATQVVEADANLLRAARIEGVACEPRAYLDTRAERFDLILHSVPDLHAAAETPLLTVEGLARALACTTPDGGVAVACALATPPRAGPKLLATAARVTPHLVAIRSADRLCVWMRHRAPSADERKTILSFCAANGFDPVRPASWRPEQPFHETRTPLDAEGRDYPYDLRPATDAKPYFFKFFRWSRLADLLDMESTPFVQWAYVALLVAFLQVTVLAALLMVGPLLLRSTARTPAPLFVAIGLGYMLVEMAYLQRAFVRTESTVHAAAAVLGGFLVGSGLGSLAGERLGRPLRRAALAVLLAAPLGYLVFPGGAIPAALLCAAVGFPMGMPFPAALARLASPSVPWALAWNGCASVAAASGAPLLSSTWGIPATLAGATLCYAFAACGHRVAAPP